MPSTSLSWMQVHEARAEVRLGRKQKARACMYESFMIVIPEKKGNDCEVQRSGLRDGKVSVTKEREAERNDLQTEQ